jgi:hypothetical protein
VAGDAAEEASAEAPEDATIDAPADAPANTTVDAPVEATVEVPTDRSADASVDTPLDTSADAPANVTEDAAADMLADGPEDAPGDNPGDAPGDNPGDAPADTPTVSGCARFTRGPAMLAAPMLTRTICVDSTEVTLAQYQQFLDAKNGDTTGQGPECAWNLSYSPALTCSFDPTGNASYPVSGVDWCDATAFCKWAGKRLCGGSTGGLIETTSASDLQMAGVSEWTTVCSQGGQRDYPYGSVLQPDACNTGEHAGSALAIVPVATMPGCEGGYPGVFDMVGNVHEWEDACYPLGGASPGPMDNCWFRGGSYHDLDSSCSTAHVVTRDYVDYQCDIGFRCCGDP